MPRVKQLRFSDVQILSSGGRMDSDDSKSAYNSDDSKSTSDESVDPVNDSDSRSVTSTSSALVQQENCPVCKKQLQARAMFKHMRTFHPEYIKTTYDTYNNKGNNIDEMIKNNAPMPIEWPVTNDFDEVELRKVWGCLACDTTFTTDQGAVKHCNAKCKKDHNAELKRFKKEEEKERKEAEKRMGKERVRWINRTPQQIYMCIKYYIDFYNNHWAKSSNDVVSAYDKLNRLYPYNDPYDCNKYVFTPYVLPAFVDNKEEMIKQENLLWDKVYDQISIYRSAMIRFKYETGCMSHEKYFELETWSGGIISSIPDPKY